MNQIIYVGKHLLTFSVPRHAHSSWELIYCTGGDGAVQFDEQSLSYQAGDVVLIPPFTPHRNESRNGFTNIHLNMTGLTLGMNSPELLRDDEKHFILDAFSGAFFQYSVAPGIQTPLLGAYANLIVCHLAAHQEAPSRSRVVIEIENSIINNYPDCNFELDVYLHSLPYSYDYLRRLFKKETGLTPHQYLTDKRLQTAAESLNTEFADSALISEVARMCGFREPLYFSRMFKNRFGMSPSSFQKRREEESSHPNLNADSVKINLD